jgi:hypothetical protein
MGTNVARQVEELYGGEIGGGDALEDLLVGVLSLVFETLDFHNAQEFA